MAESNDPKRQRWDVRLRERIEHGLGDWGHWVSRHPWPVIVSMVLLAAIVGSQSHRVRLETGTESILRKGYPAQVRYDAFREQFGREQLILISLHPDEVFELDFLAYLQRLHGALEDEVPHLDEVTSLINARLTRGVGDELLVGDLLDPWPESQADVERVRELALGNPLYRNSLLSADGRIATIIIKASAYSSSVGGSNEESGLAGFDDGQDVEASWQEPVFLTGDENTEMLLAIEGVMARQEFSQVRSHLAGGPVVGHRLYREMERNLAIFSSLSFASVGVLLFVLFRRSSAVILPLLVVGMSILTTFGVMGGLNYPLGIPTQILPSFLLAVGIGAAVHLLVVFYQAFDRGSSREAALVYALDHSGLAIIMTAVTTAGALVSFVVAEIAPVVHLGIFAPVGVLVGLLFSLVLLPALISVVPLTRRPLRSKSQGGDWIERCLIWVGDRCVARPWTVVVCMSAILIVAIGGMLRLDFTYDPLSWFPEDDPVRIDNEIIDEYLGGTAPLEMVVDTGRENGLHDPQVLRSLDRLREQFDGFEGPHGLRVGQTFSLADLVKEIHQALNENRPEFHRIPEDRELIAQELLLFENSGSDDLEELVDSHFQKTHFMLKMPNAPPVHFKGFIEEVETSFDKELGEGVTVTSTGFLSLMAEALSAITVSMIRSYLIALAIIIPLMFLLLGNARSGIAAMVPNLAPIILTLGIMGWTGVPLGLFTLLIGSIAIGLAVDDTIHFMHNFRKEFERSGDVQDAVRQTMTTTGRAMLTTSVILSLAFFIYTFADLQNLVRFGWLTGFTIVMAFVADVTLAPALMALSTRGMRKQAAKGMEPEAIMVSSSQQV